MARPDATSGKPTSMCPTRHITVFVSHLAASPMRLCYNDISRQISPRHRERTPMANMRHQRSIESARRVGRVGALAVALGIGMAAANNAGWCVGQHRRRRVVIRFRRGRASPHRSGQDQAGVRAVARGYGEQGRQDETVASGQSRASRQFRRRPRRRYRHRVGIPPMRRPACRERSRPARRCPAAAAILLHRFRIRRC